MALLPFFQAAIETWAGTELDEPLHFIPNSDDEDDYQIPEPICRQWVRKNEWINCKKIRKNGFHKPISSHAYAAINEISFTKRGR